METSVSAMMDDKLNETDMNERHGRREKRTKFEDSNTAAPKSPLKVNAIGAQTGSMNEVNSFAEQISTEDTELSSADVSVNVLSHKTKRTPTGYELKTNSKGGATAALSSPSPVSMEKEQPQLLHAPKSSSSDTFPSTKTQKSQKTKGAHNEADESDLCAAILLACLFCHPLEFLLATLRGCNGCIWSLCSSLCGCEPTTLQPLMDITQNCDLCGCLGVRCFLCDCTICDICLQATECLDLAMEISQMLYH